MLSCYISLAKLYKGVSFYTQCEIGEMLTCYILLTKLYKWVPFNMQCDIDEILASYNLLTKFYKWVPFYTQCEMCEMLYIEQIIPYKYRCRRPRYNISSSMCMGNREIKLLNTVVIIRNIIMIININLYLKKIPLDFKLF